MLGVLALITSAALAVATLSRSELLPEPPRPLEPPRFASGLYAACLPGALCLLVALGVYVASPASSAAAARLWLLGLALLLLPGLWDWARRFRRRTPSTERNGRRYAAAAVTLFVLAFAIRIWGGIDRMPGWLDSDEAATGVDGRTVFAQGARALFGFWDVGNPHVTLFVSQLAALPFGEGLGALRLGSALLGSLTVVLLFDFGRRLVGGPTAFLAALLLAVNHVFVHYSRVGQIYVDTPFFTSLVLALLLRVLTGGSFLSLTAAGIALGIGAATYVPTEILPALVLLTLLGWTTAFTWEPRRVLVLGAFLAAVVALILAPIVVTVLRITPEIAYQRIPNLSLLRPEGLRLLADTYRADSGIETMGEHFLRTVGIFNAGGDHFKAYGAQRALADSVTGALVPAAFALLFARLTSAIGWLCVVFTGAYLAGGVLLVAAQPSYHRVAAILPFISLSVAWVLVGLARALAGRLPRFRRAAGAIVLGAFVAAAAWLNLDYYFRRVPQIHLIEAGFGAGRLICRYSETHAVIDATALGGSEYFPSRNLYPDLDCPDAKWIRVDEPVRLWQAAERTGAPRVAVIVPTAAESSTPAPPSGYRLVRKVVDTSIRSPAPVSLSVLEYEREPSGGAR